MNTYIPPVVNYFITKSYGLYGRYSRFGSTELLALIKYPSSIRWFNALHNKLEYYRGRCILKSYPPCINISTGTVCNLRCKFCYTGQGKKQDRALNFIPPKLVEKAMKEIGRFLIAARLYTYGEPLLVKQLPEIVEIVHRYKVYSFISSNMNLFDEGLVKDILIAGLDHFIVV